MPDGDNWYPNFHNFLLEKKLKDLWKLAAGLFRIDFREPKGRLTTRIPVIDIIYGLEVN